MCTERFALIGFIAEGVRGRNLYSSKLHQAILTSIPNMLSALKRWEQALRITMTDGRDFTTPDDKDSVAVQPLAIAFADILHKYHSFFGETQVDLLVERP